MVDVEPSKLSPVDFESFFLYKKMLNSQKTTCGGQNPGCTFMAQLKPFEQLNKRAFLSPNIGASEVQNHYKPK